MKSDRRSVILLLVLGLILVTGCDEDPTRRAKGFVSVTVIDASGPPVPGIEIRILPLDRTALTDEQGVVLFDLAPGDYFVDASLCCMGPGFIQYHVPVTVTSGETEPVELRSCLACV